MYSIKKVYETCWCSSGIACKEKEISLILTVFTFIKKISIMSPRNFDTSVFLKVKVIKEVPN